MLKYQADAAAVRRDENVPIPVLPEFIPVKNPRLRAMIEASKEPEQRGLARTGRSEDYAAPLRRQIALRLQHKCPLPQPHAEREHAGQRRPCAR